MGGSKGIGDAAVVPVVVGHPVGVGIVVGQVGLDVELGVQSPVHVVGIGHDNGGDLAVVDAVGLGQGGHLEALLVRGTGGGGDRKSVV